MKTLLVTGGCGFIGSNFINIYYDTHPNIKIINLDAMYYCASHENIPENIRNDSGRYIFIEGNTSNFELVKFIITTYQPDIVINFAAQSHVGNCFSNSLQYTRDNILGTHTLLEVCNQYGNIHKFIHVSTDEVYGESLHTDEEGKHEETVLYPTNPYAATKAGAEMIVRSYIKSFNFPAIITRGNNVYGPNQYPEKVIPRFIQQLNNGQKITIEGDGSAVRAFCHVNDVVEAFNIIIQNGVIGEIYNIGTDFEISIIDLAKKLCALIKPNENISTLIEYVSDRDFNDQRYFVTSDKLKSLGWSQKIKFDDGLKELLDKF